MIKSDRYLIMERLAKFQANVLLSPIGNHWGTSFLDSFSFSNEIRSIFKVCLLWAFFHLPEVVPLCSVFRAGNLLMDRSPHPFYIVFLLTICWVGKTKKTILLYQMHNPWHLFHSLQQCWPSGMQFLLKSRWIPLCCYWKSGKDLASPPLEGKRGPLSHSIWSIALAISEVIVIFLLLWASYRHWSLVSCNFYYCYHHRICNMFYNYAYASYFLWLLVIVNRRTKLPK